MKFVLKILFAPVIAVLVVLVSAFALILNLSAWVFGIASTILVILGLAVLLLDNAANGVIILVIAFLVSPVGLPMLAAWMLGQIQRFRYFIQDAVYG
jgi:membrane-bound ClpP family serine protease